jgi:ferredoxin
LPRPVRDGPSRIARQRVLSPRVEIIFLTGVEKRRIALKSFSYDSDYEQDVSEFVLDSGVVDYYAVLNIDDDADTSEIKAAYRSIAKVCHPDISGDESMNMCILLNEAYRVLSDPEQRSEYNRMLDEALEDENDGYTGQMLSKWMANTRMGKNEDPNETRGVFVDECSCIGCKQCVWLAPATFRIEEEYGRSRVFGQWLDTEDDISAAIDSCPVSCIYWIEKEELPPLEYVTQNVVKRVDVGMMMAGQGGGGQDVWAATAKYMKEREEKRKQREKAAFYSRAQAAARAAAAEALAKKQMGWFDDIVQRFGVADAAERMKQSVQSSVTGSLSDDEYEAYARVGKRKRTKRRTEDGTYGARGMNGGKVPAERAIVVSAGGRKVWER